MSLHAPIFGSDLYRMPSNLAIRASAGTGKTYTLTKTILHQLAGLGHHTDDAGALVPIAPQHILAITFTEKAASEMRERIRDEVREMIVNPHGDETLNETARRIYGEDADLADVLPGRMHWRNVLASFDRMTISTFHSFAQSLLMQHPVEAELSLDVTLLDETDSDALLDEVATEVVRRSLERGDEVASRVAELAERFGLRRRQYVNHLQAELVRLLRELRQAGQSARDAARYTGDLAAEYVHAVQALLLALERLAGLRHEPELLFTVENAQSDYERRCAKRMLNAAQRTHRALAGFDRSNIDISEHRASILPLLRRTWGHLDAGAFKPYSTTHADLPLAISRLCGVLMRSLGDALRVLLIEAEAELARVKRARRVLTFTDLMLRVRALLSDNPQIRRTVQGRYVRVFVDEFQDTNPVQLEIVEMLARTVVEVSVPAPVGTDDAAKAEESEPEDKPQLSLFAASDDDALDAMMAMSEVPALVRDPLSGDFVQNAAAADVGGAYRKRALFVVGDAKQSIYGWRGARVDLFDSLFERLLAHGGSLGVLRKSYRSTPRLVELGNRLFAEGMAGFEADNDALEATRPERGAGSSAQLWAVYTERFNRPPDSPLVEEVIARIAGQWLYGPKQREVEFRLSSAQRADLEAWARGDAGAPDFVRGDQARRVEAIRESGAPHWWPRPCTPRDLTILVRTGYQADKVSWELDKAGIPNVSLTGSSFWASLEVSDCVHALLALLDPTLDYAAIAMLRSPIWGFSDDALALLGEMAGPPTLRGAVGYLKSVSADEPDLLSDADSAALGAVSDMLQVLGPHADRLGPGELLGLLFDTTHYLAVAAGLPNGKRAVANLRQLQDLGTHAATRGMTSREWAWQAHQAIQMNAKYEEAKVVTEADDVVRVMTVHKAKGLEFPICLVWAVDTGWRGRSDWAVSTERRGVLVRPREELSLPTRGSTLRPQIPELRDHDNAEEMSSALESMRLFYVAHTRACDHIGYVGRIFTGRQDSAEGWMSVLMTEADRGGLPTAFIQTRDDMPAPVAALRIASERRVPTADEIARVTRLERPQPKAARAVVGVNALVDFADRPSRFYLQHIAGADVYAEPVAVDGLLDALGYDQPAMEDDDGRDFGVSVHRALENVDWDGDDDEAIALAMHAVGWQPESRLQAIRRHVECVLESPYAGEIRAAAHRYPELPFLLALDGGACRGAIDLLLLPEAGPPVVIDFKTSSRPEERTIRRHLQQVCAYACAVRELAEPRPNEVRGVVIYTGGPHAESVEDVFDAAQLDAWRADASEGLAKVVATNIRADWFRGR